jgi:hypothetical protein
LGLLLETVQHIDPFGPRREVDHPENSGFVSHTNFVDIGFGDSVEPSVEEVDLPVLLDLPAPRLRAYARETVVAEKFQAMAALGEANSRMKDFYDVWVLSKTYDFNHERLAQAIAATFARRQTTIPEAPPECLYA